MSIYIKNLSNIIKFMDLIFNIYISNKSMLEIINIGKEYIEICNNIELYKKKYIISFELSSLLFNRKEYNNAMIYLNKTLTYLLMSDNFEIKKNTLQLMCQIYIINNDPENAHKKY